ncbi:MAG: DUF5683 domain-containing protein [bacterium]
MKFWMILIFCAAGLILIASALFADDRGVDFSTDRNPDSLSSPPGLVPWVRFYHLERPGLHRSPARSVLLSLAFPGLGQASNGRWAKASGFMVIGSMLVARILVEEQRSRRYLWLSRTAEDNDKAEEFYSHYIRHFDRRDRLVWWAVGFWLYNLFDAYVDGHLFGFSHQ